MNLEREFYGDGATTKFAHVVPLSESIKNLEYWFNALNKEIEETQAENKKLHDENYKDNELSMMQAHIHHLEAEKKAYLKDYYRGFPISKDEAEKIAEWKKKHNEEIHGNDIFSSGYTYEFYPTGLGTFGKCICSACQKRAYDDAYKTGSFDRNAYTKYMTEHNGECSFQDL